MASKNAPDDLVNEGFTPEQFGQSDASFAGYLQTVLDEATLEVSRRAGSQYTSSDTMTASSVKRAERCLAAAWLWLRRMNRVDSEVVLGSDGQRVSAKADARASYDAYLSDYERAIATIPQVAAQGDAASSAPAFGSEATGHFTTPASARNHLAGLGGVL